MPAFEADVTLRMRFTREPEASEIGAVGENIARHLKAATVLPKREGMGRTRIGVVDAGPIKFEPRGD